MKYLILSMLLINVAFAKQKVVYKYKQYERFDLGDLSVKGEIIAPGDLTVKQRSRKIFNLKLYDRNSMDDFINRDIKYLR